MLVLQVITYLVLVMSVLYWQPSFMQNQILVQALMICIITFLICRAISRGFSHKLAPVIFSQRGEWMEIHEDQQISWLITNSSRVSSSFLFIHLVSAVNASRSKWCLIYKDQVTERDFRRLCLAVIYQQQISYKD